MANIRIKRGTAAQVAAAASSAQLAPAEPYLITDEARLAVGLGASTFIKLVNDDDPRLGGGGTALADIIKPTAMSPAGPNVGAQPMLEASPYYELYGAAQTALQVQLHTADAWTAPLYDSGDKPAATSLLLPAGLLTEGTTYYWRVRYKSARTGAYSDWSDAASFTTAESFGHYIPTPDAISPAVGDPLGGGYYTGIIWQEVTQFATSTAIGTGTKVFTVQDMSTTPLFYEGQQVEVRSRANPATRMAGTVTGAFGTALTVSVSAVYGSGTLTDWSIMARYRIITAPKASGEHAGVATKPASTSYPAACATVTEAHKATAAMVAAGSSSDYPAAWWAHGLSIGGFTDWALPSREIAEMQYRAFKPGASANKLTARDVYNLPSYQTLGSYGDDAAPLEGAAKNTIPAYTGYTESTPAQTTIPAFVGSEKFEATGYWTCTEAVEGFGIYVDFANGAAVKSYKSGKRRARAIRRIPV